MKNHPTQPVLKDERGVARFQRNEIVCHLFDSGILDLNYLSKMDFDNEDWMQLAQLLGYSISGYSTLSYVSDESYQIAEKMFDEGVTEEQAKLEVIQSTLEKVRDSLRDLVPSLFQIHPDDLVK